MLKILNSSFSFVKEKYCTLIRMVVKNNRRIYPKFLSAKLLGTYLWLIDFDDFQIIVVIFPIPLTINNRVHLPTNIKNAIRKISAFWGFFFFELYAIIFHSTTLYSIHPPAFSYVTTNPACIKSPLSLYCQGRKSITSSKPIQKRK